MTIRVRPWLQYIASALLTGLFLWVALWNTDFRGLWEATRAVNYWWMLATLGLLLASHVCRAWRWRYLLDPIKSGIGLRNLFSALMIGYLMNNVLPRAGELVRPYAIGKLESIPKSSALGTIVVERVMDMVSFLLLLAAVPLVYTGTLKESFPWLASAGQLLLAGVLLGMALIVTLMLRRDWTTTLVGIGIRFIPERWKGRMEQMTHSFLDGFLFLLRPANFLIIAVLSVFVWLFYIGMMYTGFCAFGLQDRLGFGGALVVQAISSIGVAIPTPGGTGGYHAFTAQTLTRLYHVEANVALSYATVTHAVGYLGVTIVGLYYFWVDRITVSEALGKREGGKK